MIALFLCSMLVSGLTQYTDFVHVNEVSNPAQSATFGYGIAVSEDGLGMATIDPNRGELYRYTRQSRSANFSLSGTVSVPTANITHPLTGCNNGSTLAFTANNSVVFINDRVQRLDLINSTSVSVSGDCLWAVVGVPSENRIVVFSKGSAWAVFQSITGGRGFGTSVAINRNGSAIATVLSADVQDARVWIYSKTSGAFSETRTLLYPDATDFRHGRDQGVSMPSIGFSDEFLVWGASHESITGVVLVWKLDGSLHQILTPATLNPVSTVARSGRSVQISPKGEVICVQAFGGMAIYGKSFFGAFTTGSIVASPSQLVVGCSDNTAVIMGYGSIKVFSSTTTPAPTKSSSSTRHSPSLALFFACVYLLVERGL